MSVARCRRPSTATGSSCTAPFFASRLNEACKGESTRGQARRRAASRRRTPSIVHRSVSSKPAQPRHLHSPDHMLANTGQPAQLLGSCRNAAHSWPCPHLHAVESAVQLRRRSVNQHHLRRGRQQLPCLARTPGKTWTASSMRLNVLTKRTGESSCSNRPQDVPPHLQAARGGNLRDAGTHLARAHHAQQGRQPPRHAGDAACRRWPARSGPAQPQRVDSSGPADGD